MLRTDFRQWLIHDEPSMRAALRAIETLAMMRVGPALAQHKDIEIRAMGNVMIKIAEAHVKAALGDVKDYEPADEERAAMEDMLMLIPYLAGESPKPEQAADELHAALYYLDSRLNGMGISGSNYLSSLARGE